MEDLGKLAYEAELRRLDKQEDVVRELRSRTAVVLAAASFAISVAGGASARASPIATICALAAALTALGASLLVLTPRPRLRFALRGVVILVEHYPRRQDLPEVHRYLTHDLARLWNANDAIVRRLLSAFRWAVASLAMEIVLLVAALAGTL